MSRFPRIALVGKPEDKTATPLLHEVHHWLLSRCEHLAVETRTAQLLGLGETSRLDAATLGERVDLVVVVGGDGTMLGIARQVAPHGVPLVGVNSGRLGFITDVSVRNWPQVLEQILRGEYDRGERSMLSGSVMRSGQLLRQAVALNDVVISRAAFAGMLDLRVEVDGRFMAEQRADGLIVSTPTGSTAYSLAAQGPILHPSVAGMLLVPVAPHSLSNRPIALPDTCEVQIRLLSGPEAMVSFDMQSQQVLRDDDVVRVVKSEHRAVFLHPRGWNYFDTLRDKLRWYAA